MRHRGIWKRLFEKNPLAAKQEFLLDLIFQISLNFSVNFLKNKNGNKKSKKKNQMYYYTSKKQFRLRI